MPALSADEELLELIRENRLYPERLVMILWKWGEGDLQGIDRPDVWQMAFLAKLGELIRNRNFNGVDAAKLIKMAVGSGRGIGKSAMIGMLVVILLVSWSDARVTVTANTEGQLDAKVWPEVRSWVQSSIVAHWFDDNANFIRWHDAPETWFAVKSVWNLDKPQAFAGQHNRRSINVFLFDESSTIPHAIWDVTLGGMSTGLPIFFCFGNLTESTGDFADAIEGADPTFDYAVSIDARDCRFPNKAKMQDEIDRYGIDSDYVRVWIRGLPPKDSVDQFFPHELIRRAQSAQPCGLMNDALIASCDLSWGGNDPSLVDFAHGLDSWSLEPIEIPGEQTRDPEKMISILAGVLSRKFYPAGYPMGKKVTHLFMDAAGSATVIQRRLREMGFTNVTLVNFAGHAIDKKLDRNVRSEIIRRLKEYMESGAGIGMSKNLEADLKAIQKIKNLPLQFEDKDLIRKRLKRSTDRMDAKAMTRYAPVMLPEAERAEEEMRKQFAQRDVIVIGSGDSSGSGSRSNEWMA